MPAVIALRALATMIHTVSSVQTCVRCGTPDTLERFSSPTSAYCIDCENTPRYEPFDEFDD